jgi:hypothetical protein
MTIADEAHEARRYSQVATSERSRRFDQSPVIGPRGMQAAVDVDPGDGAAVGIKARYPRVLD